MVNVSLQVASLLQRRSRHSIVLVAMLAQHHAVVESSRWVSWTKFRQMCMRDFGSELVARNMWEALVKTCPAKKENAGTHWSC